MFGQVVNIKADRGFGFVRVNGEHRDIFFHAKELEGLVFDERLVGERVEFSTTNTDTGLRAVSVRRAVFQ